MSRSSCKYRDGTGSCTDRRSDFAIAVGPASSRPRRRRRSPAETGPAAAETSALTGTSSGQPGGLPPVRRRGTGSIWRPSWGTAARSGRGCLVAAVTRFRGWSAWTRKRGRCDWWHSSCRCCLMTSEGFYDDVADPVDNRQGRR